MVLMYITSERETVMDQPDEDEILQMACELQNDEMLEKVREHLAEDNLVNARICMLGFVDSRVSEGQMDGLTAKEYYRRLNFTPEEAATIRQNAASGTT